MKDPNTDGVAAYAATALNRYAVAWHSREGHLMEVVVDAANHCDAMIAAINAHRDIIPEGAYVSTTMVVHVPEAVAAEVYDDEFVPFCNRHASVLTDDHIEIEFLLLSAIRDLRRRFGA